jgi:hypothetical protein
MTLIWRMLCAIDIHDWREFGDVWVCARCRYRRRWLDSGSWELDIVDTQWRQDRVRDLSCDLPPVGWFCSRRGGHDGPCAAHPVEHNGAIELVWRDTEAPAA